MVSEENGQVTTTSNEVAQHFGKVHRDVVRAIENIECSKEFRLRNFAQSSFEAEMPNGGKRKHKAYRITAAKKSLQSVYGQYTIGHDFEFPAQGP